MGNNYTLCFDTCLDKMYVALFDGEKVLTSETIENHDSKYHSAFLISTIEKTLNKNNIKPQDLSLIGINVGPGSFTGIRACTTVARVLAQQLNIKAVGVSSLEILAGINNISLPCQSEGDRVSDRGILVALDARKNMAYLYCDDEIKGAVDLDKIKEIISSGNYLVITDNKLKPILGGISYQERDYPLGEILAKLAQEKLKDCDGDWRKLLPLYIQPPPMG